ncbi:hypothetical protein [Deinococcus ruber]|uniref:Uncharacterized protein n=1 Tax=Deinococcus ruber TaxID=1848197 RepID=A0A918CF80_9DEIO|nr:hypothetical protein [Deinococcus ruber]GGR21369.1 hypothetical protein GCM10008957_37090 [Deinococcus ruber]
MSDTAFRWTLRVDDPRQARMDLLVLSAALVTVLPAAETVLVSAQGGVQVFDAAWEPLDLGRLPFDLARWFGVGVYALPGPGRPGCRIERRYRSASVSNTPSSSKGTAS